MMNSTLVKLCVFAVVTTLIGSSPISAARPNLLIITVDDMSADSIGAFGCQLKGTTPTIDRLASESLSFRKAHVQVGNCMPSRNVMLSGRYPHNNRVQGFYQVKDADYPVMADLMKEAGYFTGIRGKVSHSTPYSPYDWNLVLDTLPNGGTAQTKDPDSYGSSTARGIEAAKEAKKPFCLVINVSDPHKPFYTGGNIFKPSRIYAGDEVPIPGFLFDDPAVRKELAEYYSTVRRADDCVNNILKALDASGQADETVVMFLSDHGMPLPFAKTQLYHHSTHTPWMVRWPGVTKPNSSDDRHMISAVDMLPTLLDIVGADHPKGFDGRSFLPLIKGQEQENRESVFKVYNENAGGNQHPMRAVQTPEYLYLFNPWSDGKNVFRTATQGTATYRRMKQLASDNPKIAARLELFDHRVVEEFYDVKNDPDCLNNLIETPEHRDALSKHRKLLESYMVETNDSTLEVFRKRDDPEVRKQFMIRVQKESAERRSKKGKGRKAENLIGLPKVEEIEAGAEFTLKLRHRFPDEMGKQTITVTLKGGPAGKRIERKAVTASGTGIAEVTFAIPEKVAGDVVQFAAFVGDDFKTSPQHVSSKAIPLK